MKRPFLLALLGTIVTGCAVAGSIFNTEPFVDARKDAKGNVVLLDTPRMWARFAETVETQIGGERAGERPPGVLTWNEHWLLVIKHMESGSQENAPKYVEYIVEQRRKAGLPRLVGYP